jgi:hypothetical protein
MMKQPGQERDAGKEIKEFLKEMADINVIKQKILDYHLKIVCIQKACKQRKLSLRNRVAFLKVYWQRLKQDM